VSHSPHSRHAASPAELKQQIVAERAGEPFLVYRDGDGVQMVVALGGAVEALSVGRDPRTDLRLAWDRQVSRVHAQLERVGGAWTLLDAATSRNGSFVNGARVTGQRRLNDGDVLRFGDAEVIFRAPAEPLVTATESSEDSVLATRVSEQQRRVLVALCRPFKSTSAFAAPASNQAIGEELFLSVGAVKAHLRSLFACFGIEDLPQNQKRLRLVELAFQSGLVAEREL
jgi:pSer/pThr/pTyr-binding forkhead associated (FHA) protein